MFESVFTVTGVLIGVFVAILEAHKYVVDGPPETIGDRIRRIRNLCFYSIDAIVILAVIVIILSGTNKVHEFDPTDPPTSTVMESNNEDYFDLTVTSDIQSCDLFVDDLPQGSIPRTVPVKSGRHRIRLESEHFKFENWIRIDSSITLHVKQSQLSWKRK